MFNAEKLLGKIVQETLGVGSSGRKSTGGGMLDSLASGQGLVTVLGLGIGAYEMFKGQQGDTPPAPPQGQAPPAIPTDSGKRISTPPPPPSPSGKQSAPPPPPVPPAVGEQAVADIQGQELALRLIRVMIAAAHADGHLDEAEEKAILDRLQGADLDSEEKMFLIQELHQPQDLAMLTAGVSEPAKAQMIYAMAVAAVEVDTMAERAWLDALGTGLGISPEMRKFIESQA